MFTPLPMVSIGRNWLQIFFEPRSGHSAVVFDNKLWITGGWSAITNEETFEQDVISYNNIWSSADGITWTELTTSPNFIGRLDHTATSFNNSIIITAGNKISTDSSAQDFLMTCGS